MKRVVEQDISLILKKLFYIVKENGLDLTIDGIPAYNSKAQFVGGILINTSCYTALELLKNEESLDTLGEIIRMAAPMEMRTWGILNALIGLYRLHKKDLLNRVVDTETYQLLLKSLDWRTFVDEEKHYALINKPTNYYGVAFGIARYRELLGWEPVYHSKYLLERFIEHIDSYSGDLEFMDETPGDGRFDRYTMVAPGEVAALLMNTGMEVPNKIRNMLRKSCNIILQLSNEAGDGCPYGRSSGAYGDTAILEALSAAAGLGTIYTEKEKFLAYGYSVSIMNKIARFWYDSKTAMANLWDTGRRTDSYRNKNRILSESLNLCMHVISCYEHWKNANLEQFKGYDGYSKALEELNPYSYVTFAEGDYIRSLAIIRDGKHVWSLPFVSGGEKYYNKDPYLQIPSQNRVLESVPEGTNHQLIPQLIMDNGDVYMPLVYTTKVTPTIEADQMIVVCEYDGLCNIGDVRPRKIEDAKVIVKYIFNKNRIYREDIWIMSNNLVASVKEARLVFLTFSDTPSVNENEVTFENGVISGMKVNGYETCEVNKVPHNGDYDTSHGRLNYEVIWRNANLNKLSDLTFNWNITYRDLD